MRELTGKQLFNDEWELAKRHEKYDESLWDGMEEELQYWYHMLAKMITDKYINASRWILTSTKLPTDNRTKFVQSTHGKLFEAHFNTYKEIWKTKQGLELPQEIIECWQPLPEPFKNDKHDNATD